MSRNLFNEPCISVWECVGVNEIKISRRKFNPVMYSLYIDRYTFEYICVSRRHTHTNTHTHIYIYVEK